MRVPDLSKWDNSKNIEGLLFFAQRMNEMLFDYTLDSYKAPILNSHRLCLELKDTISNLKNREKDNMNLVNSIVKELNNQMSQDPIALELLDKEHKKLTREAILKELDQSKSFYSLENSITPLIKLFEKSYFEEIKRQLKQAIVNNEEPTKIDRLSSIFVSELLMIGYSKNYLYLRVNKFFFTSKTFFHEQKIEKYIDSFLHYFQKEQQKWKIIIRGGQNFKYFKEIEDFLTFKISDQKPNIQTKWSGEKEFIESNVEKYPYYIIFENFEAYDQYQARKNAIDDIEFYNNLLAYSTYYISLDWDPKMLIYSKNNYVSIVDNEVSPMAKNTKFKPFNQTDHNVDLNIFSEHKNIYANLNPLSVYSFYKSLNFQNSALHSDNPENQYLNLWIGLETLSNTPPGEKIGFHFRNSFTPFLCRNYIEKLLLDLCNQLEYFLNTKFEKILSNSTTGDSKLEKCAYLISKRNENQEMWDEIFTELGRNPLLKYRMTMINTKIESPKMIKKTIIEHQQRIDWHLERMYRTRNMITHKGEPIEIINQLIENLHFYYHTIIDQIEEITNKYDHIDNIESVIELVKIEYHTHLQNLKENEKKELDSQNYLPLLFGE